MNVPKQFVEMEKVEAAKKWLDYVELCRIKPKRRGYAANKWIKRNDINNKTRHDGDVHAIVLCREVNSDNNRRHGLDRAQRRWKDSLRSG